MTVIFKAKTREGYSLKLLAELLQNNIKTACFEIDEKGIRLCMMDHHRTILIDIDLQSDNFSVYKFIYPEKMYIGINLIHFHKMLKTIKKRDSVEFFIVDNCMSDLGIKIIPKENNRITTSFIKIQNIQNIQIDLPSGYGKPVIVPSGEFQKMCKGLTHISNSTHITSKGFLIRFSSDAGGVMKRFTEFGETEEETEEIESKNQQQIEEYAEDFDSEQLLRITKIAGLNSTMQIYPKSNTPLLFRTLVGSLGKISIYLKSKNLQEDESRTIDTDEET
jgi:proliferating cell nuclear antigen PCNA